MKLEYVLSNLRQKCQKYWIPGSRLTVDEIILRYKGRTTQKIQIPGKPIDCGFKLFGLSCGGYIYTWEATKPGLNEGFSLDRNKYSVTIPNTDIKTFLTPTQATVIRLANSLAGLQIQGHRFYLYLDNLFVSWKLYYYFSLRDIAVTGTVRKGAAGYPPRLLVLKNASTALAWGAIQATVLVGNVAAFLWQDNNLVMGITTSPLTNSILIYPRNDYRS